MNTIIESHPTPATPPAPAAHPSLASDDRPLLRRRLPYAACVVVACVLMFANYLFAVPLQFIPGTARLAERSQAFATVWNVLLCVVTLATALVLATLVGRRVLGARLRRLGLVLTRDSLPMFLVGWAAAAGIMVLSQLVTPLLGFDERRVVGPDEWAKLTVGAVVATVIMKVFQGLALQAIPEELVWRGWLMHCLEQRPRLALTVSAIVFGSLHLLSSGGQQNLAERFVYVGQAMAFAFAGGALALRLRSLWAAIGVHGGLHLTNLVLNFTPLNGSGPANWMSLTIGWTIVGLLVLRGWRGTRVIFDR